MTLSASMLGWLQKFLSADNKKTVKVACKCIYLLLIRLDTVPDSQTLVVECEKDPYLSMLVLKAFILRGDNIAYQTLLQILTKMPEQSLSLFA